MSSVRKMVQPTDFVSKARSFRLADCVPANREVHFSLMLNQTVSNRVYLQFLLFSEPNAFLFSSNIYSVKF